MQKQHDTRISTSTLSVIVVVVAYKLGPLRWKLSKKKNTFTSHAFMSMKTKVCSFMKCLTYSQVLAEFYVLQLFLCKICVRGILSSYTAEILKI